MKLEYQKLTLKLAATYNVVWGAWAVFFPQHFFELVGMEKINHPMVWQGMGMVIGVYGLGYWWASYNPLRHWPIIMVGFLGKIFGPLGFVFNYLQGIVPFEFIYNLSSTLISKFRFSYNSIDKASFRRYSELYRGKTTQYIGLYGKAFPLTPLNSDFLPKNPLQ